VPIRFESPLPRRPGSRASCVFFSLTALLVLVAVIRVALSGGLSADEVEHAHTTWALAEGAPPFEGFRQNHMPTLHLLLRGLFETMDFSASALLVARLTCLASWGVAMWLGVLMLRMVVPAPTRLESTLMLLVAAASVIPLQGYRLRPDPFMATFVVAAIWAAMHLPNRPWRHAGLSGLFTGLAASFSIKMGLVCLLVPLLALLAARRTRSWRPLAWGPVALLGFCIGIAPTMVWIWQAGHLQRWLEVVIVYNWTAMNTSERILTTLSQPIIGIALLGTLAALFWKTKAQASSSLAFTGMVMGALLSVGTVLMASSHLSYNAQCFAVPGACTLSLTTGRIAVHLRHWSVRYTVIVGLLAAVLYGPLRTGLDLKTEGSTAKLEDVRFLQQLTADGDACFAFVPMHPIRCRNAAPIYLGWDFYTPLRTPLTESGRAYHRKLWMRSLGRVVAEKPRLIALPMRFAALVRMGFVGRTRRIEFERLLREEYEYKGKRSETAIFVRR